MGGASTDLGAIGNCRPEAGDQLGGVDAKACGQPDDVLERQVALTSLHRGHVGEVQADLLGERHLAQLKRCPAFTDTFSEYASRIESSGAAAHAATPTEC